MIHRSRFSQGGNPPYSAAAAGVSPQQLADQVEAKAATHLRKVAATLPQDLSVTTVLRQGDPAEEILALLREQLFDMLCMGARGRGASPVPCSARCRPPCCTTARCL